MSFRPGLIDEAEAQTIVSRRASLLISHADRDVIVSASFLFAMSLGMPVIAVETPDPRWIARRVGSKRLRLASDVDSLLRTPLERPPADAQVSANPASTIDRE